MSTPIGELGEHRTLRVVVMGNSAPLMIKNERSSKANGSYAEMLELELRARGYAGAEVLNRAEWYGVVKDSRRIFPSAVRAIAPDVVVIQYGGNEAGVNSLPTRLFMLLYSWMLNPGEHGRQKWERDGARAVWKRARRWQQFYAKRAGRFHWGYRVSPEAYEAEFLLLLDAIRRDVGSQVFLVDTFPPHQDAEFWLPGQDARTRELNATLQRIAERAGAELVPAYDLCKAWGPDSVPDGFHLSEEAHARMGAYLADRIAATLVWPPK